MDKTQAELFKEELDVLLAKYPTVRLTVAHQIQAEEIKPVEDISIAKQVTEVDAPTVGTNQ